LWRHLSLQKQQHSRAFYPCCGSDVSEPRRLLAQYVDEIIFCDRRSFGAWSVQDDWPGLAAAHFMTGDARDVIGTLPPISLLFYRKDSTGEGGSGIFILGKQWLREILRHFPASGGLIITDGSNSGGGMFRKMTRPSGHTKSAWGWKFHPAPDQELLHSHRLHKIEVTRITQQSPPAYPEGRADAPSGSADA
jgi:hypothetical protein